MLCRVSQRQLVYQSATNQLAGRRDKSLTFRRIEKAAGMVTRDPISLAPSALVDD